ncbi:hypothetical protein ACOSQ3_004154 [Xanthoceras sorbifolium]
MIKLAKESASRPMGLSHDIVPHLNPFLHKLAATYKRIFVVWFGTTPRVAVMDPKLIKAILTDKSGDIKKTEMNQIVKLFGSGIASYEGEKWVKHRKIIHPAFHIDKLKEMLPAFSRCSDELIEKWNKSVRSAGSCELNVYPEFQKLNGEYITRTAFDSNFEEGSLIFSLQKEQAKLVLRSQLIMNFPLLRFLPTKVNKRMKQIYGEVRVLLGGIIDKRVKSMQMGDNEKEDLLGLLLKSNMKELQDNYQNSNAGMTTEDIIEECNTFYTAGSDTIVNLLTWSMVALSMHQNWQERAREEVLKILGKNKPTFDDLNHLKLVNMILLEVLRLYPPTSIVRRTTRKTKLGDFYLPAGVELFIPLHTVHRNPEQWGEDALEFNPQSSSVCFDHINYMECKGVAYDMVETKDDREAAEETRHPWASIQVGACRPPGYQLRASQPIANFSAYSIHHLPTEDFPSPSLYPLPLNVPQEPTTPQPMSPKVSPPLQVYTQRRNQPPAQDCQASSISSDSPTAVDTSLPDALAQPQWKAAMLEELQALELFATGLASYDGDKWAKHRKIINPAFHFEKLKQMLPAFSTCTEELIVKWEKLVSSDGGCELDVSLEFLNLTGDVISRAAFGSNFEEGRLIFLLQKEQGKLFLRTQLNMSLPYLRFMPTKVNKRMRQIYGEVGALLRGITEKREESIQMGSDEKDDLLNLFNQNSNAGMTTEDVIEECKLFYFADQETTANLLTWSMTAMSMHQNWQERAREEVLQIVGKNKPTFDDLNHLKILNMILLEVLRLYPPTSLLRRTTKKTKLGDFYLPLGVQLFIPLHIVHRDPEQWGKDALEFNPERFAEGIAKASKDQVSYFPDLDINQIQEEFIHYLIYTCIYKLIIY